MNKLIMYVGNIGQGKSLISSKLAKKGMVIVNMDSILMMVHGGEYGLFDPNKKEIYRQAEEAVIISALKKEFDVVVDRTNMKKERRQLFIEMAREYTDEIECYHFGKGDKEVCLRNRMKSPRGVPRTTWEHVYEKMACSYEEPCLDEGFSRIVKMPENFISHAFAFHGAVVSGINPDLNEPVTVNIEKMKILWEDLSNVLIVLSDGKDGSKLQVRDFLIKKGIPFDTIDYNPVGSEKGSINAHHFYEK